MVGLYAKQAEWDSFWRSFFFKEIGFETQFSLNGPGHGNIRVYDIEW